MTSRIHAALSFACISMGALPWLGCEATHRDSTSYVDPVIDPGEPPHGSRGGGGAVSADPPPPPIEGGTLLITSGGLAVASDPERDAVFVADLEAGTRLVVQLEPGDQPGRAVEDGAGRVHVALRGSGAVVTIDPSSAEMLERRKVCAAASGIAYDGADDRLYVACETGELVSWSPREPGERVFQLGPDLRDVVVYGDAIFVSRFRSAQVLTLDRAGNLVRSWSPPDDDASPKPDLPLVARARVAWRMRAVPSQGVQLLYQYHQVGPSAYVTGEWDNCFGAVFAAIARVDVDTPVPKLLPGVLVVDFASRFDEADRFATAATGTGWNHQEGTFVIDWTAQGWPFQCVPVEERITWTGDYEVTAVAWDREGHLVAQTRQPALLMHQVGNTTKLLELSDVDRSDTGLRLFHRVTASGLSCASCHPAGRDDGHVWRISTQDDRRTQSLAGTLTDTAPYQWDGSMPDLPALIHEIGVERMGAHYLEDEMGAFTAWLLALPRPPQRTGDPAQVAQGRAIFEDLEVGCSSCHAGSMLTDNSWADVGRAVSVQVPSLVGLGLRAPFMRDGCAETLAELFEPDCGGDAHGHTEQLDPAQIAALIAYLETL